MGLLRLLRSPSRKTWVLSERFGQREAHAVCEPQNLRIFQVLKVLSPLLIFHFAFHTTNVLVLPIATGFQHLMSTMEYRTLLSATYVRGSRKERHADVPLLHLLLPSRSHLRHSPERESAESTASAARTTIGSEFHSLARDWKVGKMERLQINGRQIKEDDFYFQSYAKQWG